MINNLMIHAFGFVMYWLPTLQLVFLVRILISTLATDPLLTTHNHNFKNMYSLSSLLSMVLPAVLFASSCAAGPASPTIVFVGSTPGDEIIKSQLAISAATKVDFIRWNLVLKNPRANGGEFVLNISFGEAKPNTLGFKEGGGKQIFEGDYSISQSGSKNIYEVIYHFSSSKLPTGIDMVKLNDNLLHLVTAQKQLVIGNGGWSYTLNREVPIKNLEVVPASALTNDSASQVVFDGRSPCREIADEHPEMNASHSCFKLKWRLVLNRDAVTHQPTTYTIRKVVDNIPRDVSGNWEIIKGIPSNSKAVIYQLDPGTPENSIFFLAADDNILFFLNKQHELLVGNADFSFTLNKKQRSDK